MKYKHNQLSKPFLLHKELGTKYSWLFLKNGNGLCSLFNVLMTIVCNFQLRVLPSDRVVLVFYFIGEFFCLTVKNIINCNYEAEP